MSTARRLLTVTGLSAVCFLAASALGGRGDVAIFTEVGGGDAITSSVFSHDWDTEVRNDGAGSSYALSGSEITLVEGGHYFAMYNTQIDSTGGSNRSEVQSLLELNGTDLATGWSQGFMRRQDNSNWLITSGAGVFEANPGSTLQLQSYRSDVNNGATTERSAAADASHAIQLLKLDDAWDYCRLSRTVDAQTGPSGSTFIDVTYDTQDELDTGSFDHADSDITLKQAGHYLVVANTYIEKSHDKARSNYIQRLTLNGAAVEGSQTTVYIRGDQDNEQCYEGAASIGMIVETTDIDTILNVEIMQETGATSTIMDGRTAVTIVKLPDTADYIRLTDTDGDNINPNDWTPAGWDNELELDPVAFTHTGSQIGVAQTDDYLFLSAVDTEGDGNPARVMPRQGWDVNGGGDPLDYGQTGMYDRDHQGSSAAGNFSGIIAELNAGDTVETIYTKTTQTGAVPATHMGLQGVRLSSLFPALTGLSWDEAGDGNWADVDGGLSRWKDNGSYSANPPGADDVAFIDGNTVTVAAAQGDQAVDILSIQGGSLVIEPGVSLAATTGVNLIEGTLDVDGTLDAGLGLDVGAGTTATIAGTLDANADFGAATVAAGGTLTFEATATADLAALGSAGELTIASGMTGSIGSLIVTDGNAVIPATGPTIADIAAGGGNVDLACNAATLDVSGDANVVMSQPLTTDVVGVSGGTLHVLDSMDTLTPTVSDAGVLVVDGNATFRTAAFSATANLHGDAEFTGSGGEASVISGGQTTVDGAVGGAGLTVSGGTLHAKQTLDVDTLTTAAPGSLVVDGNATVGTAVIGGTATLNADLTATGAAFEVDGGTVTVAGATDATDLTVTNSGMLGAASPVLADSISLTGRGWLSVGDTLAVRSGDSADVTIAGGTLEADNARALSLLPDLLVQAGGRVKLNEAQDVLPVITVQTGGLLDGNTTGAVFRGASVYDPNEAGVNVVLHDRAVFGAEPGAPVPTTDDLGSGRLMGAILGGNQQFLVGDDPCSNADIYAGVSYGPWTASQFTGTVREGTDGEGLAVSMNATDATLGSTATFHTSNTGTGVVFSGEGLLTVESPLDGNATVFTRTGAFNTRAFHVQEGGVGDGQTWQVDNGKVTLGHNAALHANGVMALGPNAVLMLDFNNRNVGSGLIEVAEGSFVVSNGENRTGIDGGAHFDWNGGTLVTRDYDFHWEQMGLPTDSNTARLNLVVQASKPHEGIYLGDGSFLSVSVDNGRTLNDAGSDDTTIRLMDRTDGSVANVVFTVPQGRSLTLQNDAVDLLSSGGDTPDDANDDTYAELLIGYDGGAEPWLPQGNNNPHMLARALQTGRVNVETHLDSGAVTIRSGKLAFQNAAGDVHVRGDIVLTDNGMDKGLRLANFDTFQLDGSIRAHTGEVFVNDQAVILARLFDPDPNNHLADEIVLHNGSELYMQLGDQSGVQNVLQPIVLEDGSGEEIFLRIHDQGTGTDWLDEVVELRDVTIGDGVVFRIQQDSYNQGNYIEEYGKHGGVYFSAAMDGNATVWQDPDNNDSDLRVTRLGGSGTLTVGRPEQTAETLTVHIWGDIDDDATLRLVHRAHGRIWTGHDGNEAAFGGGTGRIIVGQDQTLHGMVDRTTGVTARWNGEARIESGTMATLRAQGDFGAAPQTDGTFWFTDVHLEPNAVADMRTHKANIAISAVLENGPAGPDARVEVVGPDDSVAIVDVSDAGTGNALHLLADVDVFLMGRLDAPVRVTGNQGAWMTTSDGEFSGHAGNNDMPGDQTVPVLPGQGQRFDLGGQTILFDGANGVLTDDPNAGTIAMAGGAILRVVYNSDGSQTPLGGDTVIELSEDARLRTYVDPCATYMNRVGAAVRVLGGETALISSRTRQTGSVNEHGAVWYENVRLPDGGTADVDVDSLADTIVSVVLEDGNGLLGPAALHNADNSQRIALVDVTDAGTGNTLRLTGDDHIHMMGTLGAPVEYAGTGGVFLTASDANYTELNNGWVRSEVPQELLPGAGRRFDLGGQTLTLSGGNNGLYHDPNAGTIAVREDAILQVYHGATVQGGATFSPGLSLELSDGGRLGLHGNETIDANGVQYYIPYDVRVDVTGDGNAATVDGELVYRDYHSDSTPPGVQGHPILHLPDVHLGEQATLNLNKDGAADLLLELVADGNATVLNTEDDTHVVYGDIAGPGTVTIAGNRNAHMIGELSTDVVFASTQSADWARLEAFADTELKEDTLDAGAYAEFGLDDMAFKLGGHTLTVTGGRMSLAVDPGPGRIALRDGNQNSQVYYGRSRDDDIGDNGWGADLTFDLGNASTLSLEGQESNDPGATNVNRFLGTVVVTDTPGDQDGILRSARDGADMDGTNPRIVFENIELRPGATVSFQRNNSMMLIGELSVPDGEAMIGHWYADDVDIQRVVSGGDWPLRIEADETLDLWGPIDANLVYRGSDTDSSTNQLRIRYGSGADANDLLGDNGWGAGRVFDFGGLPGGPGESFHGTLDLYADKTEDPNRDNVNWFRGEVVVSNTSPGLDATLRSNKSGGDGYSLARFEHVRLAEDATVELEKSGSDLRVDNLYVTDSNATLRTRSGNTKLGVIHAMDKTLVVEGFGDLMVDGAIEDANIVWNHVNTLEMYYGEARDDQVGEAGWGHDTHIRLTNSGAASVEAQSPNDPTVDRDLANLNRFMGTVTIAPDGVAGHDGTVRASLSGNGMPGMRIGYFDEVRLLPGAEVRLDRDSAFLIVGTLSLDGNGTATMGDDGVEINGIDGAGKTLTFQNNKSLDLMGTFDGVNVVWDSTGTLNLRHGQSRLDGTGDAGWGAGSTVELAAAQGTLKLHCDEPCQPEDVNINRFLGTVFVRDTGDPDHDATVSGGLPYDSAGENVSAFEDVRLDPDVVLRLVNDGSDTHVMNLTLAGNGTVKSRTNDGFRLGAVHTTAASAELLIDATKHFELFDRVDPNVTIRAAMSGNKNLELTTTPYLDGEEGFVLSGGATLIVESSNETHLRRTDSLEPGSRLELHETAGHIRAGAEGALWGTGAEIVLNSSARDTHIYVENGETDVSEPPVNRVDAALIVQPGVAATIKSHRSGPDTASNGKVDLRNVVLTENASLAFFDNDDALFTVTGTVETSGSLVNTDDDEVFTIAGFSGPGELTLAGDRRIFVDGPLTTDGIVFDGDQTQETWEVQFLQGASVTAQTATFADAAGDLTVPAGTVFDLGAATFTGDTDVSNWDLTLGAGLVEAEVTTNGPIEGSQAWTVRDGGNLVMRQAATLGGGSYRLEGGQLTAAINGGGSAGADIDAAGVASLLVTRRDAGGGRGRTLAMGELSFTELGSVVTIEGGHGYDVSFDATSVDAAGLGTVRAMTPGTNVDLGGVDLSASGSGLQIDANDGVTVTAGPLSGGSSTTLQFNTGRMDVPSGTLRLRDSTGWDGEVVVEWGTLLIDHDLAGYGAAGDMGIFVYDTTEIDASGAVVLDEVQTTSLRLTNVAAGTVVPVGVDFSWYADPNLIGGELVLNTRTVDASLRQADGAGGTQVLTLAEAPGAPNFDYPFKTAVRSLRAGADFQAPLVIDGEILLGDESGSGKDFALSGGIGGAGSFRKVGGETVTLAASNTYDGDTVVEAGRLVMADNAAFGAAGNVVTLHAGAELGITAADANFASDGPYDLVLDGQNVIDVSAAGANLLDVDLDDGTLILRDAMVGATAPTAPVLGRTEIEVSAVSADFELGLAGTIQAGADADVGAFTDFATADPWWPVDYDVADGATLTFAGDEALDANQAWGVSAGGTVVFSGDLTGGVDLAKTGEGTLVLDGGGTDLGRVTVGASPGGMIRMAAAPDAAFVSAGSAYSVSVEDHTFAEVENASTGVLALSADSGVDYDFTRFPADTLGLGAMSAATFDGNLTPSAVGYRFGGGGGVLTVADTLEDHGGATDARFGWDDTADPNNAPLPKGRVILAAPATLTGDVDVWMDLAYGADAALDVVEPNDGRWIHVHEGGSVDLGGHTARLDNLSMEGGSIASTGGVLDANDLAAIPWTGDYIIGSNADGNTRYADGAFTRVAANLIKVGTDTAVLQDPAGADSNNTYATDLGGGARGATTVQGGVLEVAEPSSLGGTADLVVGEGGTVAFRTGGDLDANVALDGTLSVAAGKTVTLSDPNVRLTPGGSWSGEYAVLTGGGTLSLAGRSVAGDGVLDITGGATLDATINAGSALRSFQVEDGSKLRVDWADRSDRQVAVVMPGGTVEFYATMGAQSDGAHCTGHHTFEFAVDAEAWLADANAGSSEARPYTVAVPTNLFGMRNGSGDDQMQFTTPAVTDGQGRVHHPTAYIAKTESGDFFTGGTLFTEEDAEGGKVYWLVRDGQLATVQTETSQDALGATAGDWLAAGKDAAIAAKHLEGIRVSGGAVLSWFGDHGFLPDAAWRTPDTAHEDGDGFNPGEFILEDGAALYGRVYANPAQAVPSLLTLGVTDGNTTYLAYPTVEPSGPNTPVAHFGGDVNLRSGVEVDGGGMYQALVDSPGTVQFTGDLPGAMPVDNFESLDVQAGTAALYATHTTVTDVNVGAGGEVALHSDGNAVGLPNAALTVDGRVRAAAGLVDLSASTITSPGGTGELRADAGTTLVLPDVDVHTITAEGTVQPTASLDVGHVGVGPAGNLPAGGLDVRADSGNVGGALTASSASFGTLTITGPAADIDLGGAPLTAVDANVAGAYTFQASAPLVSDTLTVLADGVATITDPARVDANSLAVAYRGTLRFDGSGSYAAPIQNEGLIQAASGVVDLGSMVVSGQSVTAVPTADLEAYYTFDDANDLGKDDTGNGHDAWNVENATGVAGYKNGGMAVAGDGGLVGLAGNVFNNAMSRRTVTAWIRQDDANGAQLVYEEGGATNGFGIAIDGGEVIARVQNESSGLTVDAGRLLAAGWRHVAAVYDTGTVTLYVDGEGANSRDDVADTIGDHGNGPGIGKVNDQSAFTDLDDLGGFRGVLDDLRFYTGALDPVEVAILAGRGVALGSLRVDAGATLRMGGFTHTDEVTVAGELELGDADSDALSLAFEGDGLLDLGDGMLRVVGGELADIWTEIQAGRGAGDWAGTSGITSRLVAGKDLGIGCYDDGNGVVVGVTLLGDLNMDRTVDGDDLAIMSGSFGQAGGWWNGDVTYDGVVDYLDYVAYKRHYENSYTGGGEVPEPMTALLLAFGGAALLRRRRRRN